MVGLLEENGRSSRPIGSKVGLKDDHFYFLGSAPSGPVLGPHGSSESCRAVKGVDTHGCSIENIELSAVGIINLSVLSRVPFSGHWNRAQ